MSEAQRNERTASSIESRTCWPSPVRVAREQAAVIGLRADDGAELVGQHRADQAGPLVVGARLHGGEPGQRLDQGVVDPLPDDGPRSPKPLIDR